MIEDFVLSQKLVGTHSVTYRVSQKDRYDIPQQECSVLLTPEDIILKKDLINVH